MQPNHTCLCQHRAKRSSVLDFQFHFEFILDRYLSRHRPVYVDQLPRRETAAFRTSSERLIP
jgi:hypothetical protein